MKNVFFRILTTVKVKLYNTFTMQSDQPYLPTVLWSQREDTLKLVVKIPDCGHPKIELDKFDIKFSAITKDESKKYAFELKFFEAIETEGMIHKVTSQEVIIHLQKFGLQFFWPRLCDSKNKPHFLKLDFDSWMSEEDFEDQKNKQMEARNKKDDERDALEKQKREDAIEVERIKQDLHRRSVLFIYNFIQLLMFALVFLNCIWGFFQNGTNFNAYKTCGKAVEYSVVMSALEILFVWGGLTKGKVKTAAFQWIARAFSAYCLFLASDIIGGKPYVGILYLAWSGIDIIRYPFYIINLLTLEVRTITWLRYTLWIPLYPLGGICELLVLINAAMHIYANTKYAFIIIGNFSFGMAHIIAFYCLLVPFGFATLYRHMWRSRVRKYGRKFKAT